jgi:hypothetical protein
MLNVKSLGTWVRTHATLTLHAEFQNREEVASVAAYVTVAFQEWIRIKFHKNVNVKYSSESGHAVA